MYNSNFLTLTCSLICHFHHHWLPRWKISEIRMMLVNYHGVCLWRTCVLMLVIWESRKDLMKPNDLTRENPWDLRCQSDFCHGNFLVTWTKLKHESLKTMKSRARDTSTIPPVIPYLRVLKPTLPFNSTEEASSHVRPHTSLAASYHLTLTCGNIGIWTPPFCAGKLIRL